MACGYNKEASYMFNSVNNPFNRRIESSTSSDKNGNQQRQQEQKQPERNLLDEESEDEVKIGGRPIMTEDDIIAMTKSYIARIKEENGDDEKLNEKADKWLARFDVKKFMKQNPSITISDFNMIMYSETESLRKS
ncbi:hypothetical protein IKP85_03985 [bacterium]|nr:hypothetical protein [bacterium]